MERIPVQKQIKLRRFETGLPKEVEEEIENHKNILKAMLRMFHRTTHKEAKRLAFEVVYEIGIETRFIQEKEMAV